MLKRRSFLGQIMFTFILNLTFFSQCKQIYLDMRVSFYL